MRLRDIVNEAHWLAIDKGFYGEDGKKDRNKAELVMLVVTELAEAVEALRKENLQENLATNNWRKDTFEDEIADAFIRLADLCGYMKIDIEEQIRLKMQYNKTRPPMHGKKF